MRGEGSEGGGGGREGGEGGRDKRQSNTGNPYIDERAHMKMASLSTTHADSLNGNEYPLWRRYLCKRETFLSSFVDT